MCDDPAMAPRRRLPWALAVPLMVAGSLAAHLLGFMVVAARVSTTVDGDGGAELAPRVHHGYVTILPVLVGLVSALILVAVGLRIYRRVRRVSYKGASPASFLLLPMLAYALQEVAERLLHAESFLFNPAREPAFILALVLQVPFGIIAFFLGRALLGLGRKLARVLFGGRRPWSGSRPASMPRVRDAILLRIPVLALGHSVRGPPDLAVSS